MCLMHIDQTLTKFVNILKQKVTGTSTNSECCLFGVSSVTVTGFKSTLDFGVVFFIVTNLNHPFSIFVLIWSSLEIDIISFSPLSIENMAVLFSRRKHFFFRFRVLLAEKPMPFSF